MFGAQPLTQPFAGMSIYCPIGVADRPETEVVGPTVHHLIELRCHRKRPVLLSITHKLSAEDEAELDVCEAGESSPHDGVSWRRVFGASEVASKAGQFGQIQGVDPTLLSPGAICLQLARFNGILPPGPIPVLC